jgi:hypothetical protein
MGALGRYVRGKARMDIHVPTYLRQMQPYFILGFLAVLVSIVLVCLYYFVYFPVPVERYYVTTIEYDKCYAAGSEEYRAISLEANSVKYTIVKAIWTRYSLDEGVILEALCRSSRGTIWLSSKDSTDIKGISTRTFSIDPSVGAEHDKADGRALLWMALMFFGSGTALIVLVWLEATSPYVRKQHTLDEVLPYRVRAPLWLKLLQLPAFIMFWAFFWPTPEPYIVKTIREGNYFLFIMMLFTFVIICSGILEINVQKTILYRHGIEHRSRIGITSFRGYDDIEFLRFKATSLTIVFSDSYKITIFEAVANLTLITQIIDRLAPRRINHVIE